MRGIDYQDCGFFHVIDLPEGTTDGLWDFRETEAAYHGNYDFGGKRVLEIGAASGSHSFWLERQGADVVPYDLSPDLDWDVLHPSTYDAAELDAKMRRGIRRINNSWHYARDRLGSKLELKHGTIYSIPEELGRFDVITFGSVLLHVRDPLNAVQHAAGRADTIIITDRLPPAANRSKPIMELLIRPDRPTRFGGWTWWWISPPVFINFLGVLGFKKFDLTESKHRYVPRTSDVPLYTLIASR